MAFLKPAPGRSVREPMTMRLLPEEGREVRLNPFWLRRLRDGDVVEVEAPQKHAAHAPRHKGD